MCIYGEIGAECMHQQEINALKYKHYIILYIKALAIPLSETEQCVVLAGVCHQLVCGRWYISQSPERRYYTQTPEHEPEKRRESNITRGIVDRGT